MDSRAVNLSYASGASDQPLIGLPISQFFDNIVARYGEREAVVSCHQGTRWTYTQLAEKGKPACAGVYRGWLCEGRPGRYLVTE
jgi:fatty-acyl-CoA synthase